MLAKNSSQSKADPRGYAPQKSKRIEISLKWAHISHYSIPDEFFSVLETSLKYATELNDEPMIAHLDYWFGQRNYMTGNFKQAMEHYSYCIELTEQGNDKALLAQAYAAIGRVFVVQVNYLKANEFLEKSLPLLKELGETDAVAYAGGYLCMSYSFIGNFVKAFSYGKEAVKIADDAGDLTRISSVYYWLGLGYLFQGNLEECLKAINQSIRFASQLSNDVFYVSENSILGLCLFMKGNREEGLLKIQEGVEIMESNKFYLYYPVLYGFLAYCYAQAGMLGEVRETAEKCLEWSLKSWKGHESLAYYALALAESKKEQPSFKEVDQYMNKGLHSSLEREQRPFLSWGYFHYAQILFDRGDQQKAKDNLNQATKLFSEMKMTWWLEQAKELEEGLATKQHKY